MTNVESGPSTFTFHNLSVGKTKHQASIKSSRKEKKFFSRQYYTCCRYLSPFRKKIAYHGSGDRFYVRASGGQPVSGLSLNSFGVFQFLLKFQRVTGHLTSCRFHCCYLNSESVTGKHHCQWNDLERRLEKTS